MSQDNPQSPGKESPTESKADFARRRGVNRSTVTRWAEQGRIVVNGYGQVLINESLAMLNATNGHRIDLQARHAQNRNALATSATGQINGVFIGYSDDNHDTYGDDESFAEVDGESTTQYQAIRYKAENDLNALNHDLEQGTRIKKDDLIQSMVKLALHLKQGVERITDNLAPQLKHTQQDRHTLIQTALDELQGSLK